MHSSRGGIGSLVPAWQRLGWRQIVAQLLHPLPQLLQPLPQVPPRPLRPQPLQLLLQAPPRPLRPQPSPQASQPLNHSPQVLLLLIVLLLLLLLFTVLLLVLLRLIRNCCRC